MNPGAEHPVVVDLVPHTPQSLRDRQQWSQRVSVDVILLVSISLCPCCCAVDAVLVLSLIDATHTAEHEGSDSVVLLAVGVIVVR